MNVYIADRFPFTRAMAAHRGQALCARNSAVYTQKETEWIPRKLEARIFDYEDKILDEEERSPPYCPRVLPDDQPEYGQDKLSDEKLCTCTYHAVGPPAVDIAGWLTLRLRPLKYAFLFTWLLYFSRLPTPRRSRGYKDQLRHSLSIPTQ